MTTGESIQVATAVVLAATLGGVLWYACETRKMAKATVKLAEASIRPVMELWIDRIAVADLKEKPIILHYRNFGNGPARNLEWKAEPPMKKWVADGIEKTKVTRNGMGTHDNEAWIECYPVNSNGARLMIVEYEDVAEVRWRTTLDLAVEGEFLGNEKTAIERVDHVVEGDGKMRLLLPIAVLVAVAAGAVAVAVWASVADAPWEDSAGGAKSSEGSEALLCEDALERRKAVEDAFQEPVSLPSTTSPIEGPLSAFRDSPPFSDEVTRLESELSEIEGDIQHFCE